MQSTTMRRSHCALRRSRTLTQLWFVAKSTIHYAMSAYCVTYWSRTNLFALKGQGETALLRSHWVKYRTRTRTLTLEGSHATINTNLACGSWELRTLDSCLQGRCVCHLYQQPISGIRGIRTPPSPWQGDTTTIILRTPFASPQRVELWQRA